jgi:bifunctional DNA primase/polymerase-like protein/primase-like protein
MYREGKMTQPTNFAEHHTRQQMRDFANTLDAVSLILKAIGFRSHKLRDVVDALQGIAGGRGEFNCSHSLLARRLEHSGNDKAAETYAFRKVAGLKKEQSRIGVMLFGIESGGGIEHKPMHYTDYLTPVANWAMQQARASETWKVHPGKALAEQIPEAVEMLPKVNAGGNQEKDSMPLDDNAYIQKMINQSINYALKACDRAAEKGTDDIAIARMAAERLIRYAEDRHNSRAESNLQICRFEDEGSQNTEEKPNLQVAALDYVNDDVPVFPVKADKSPYTPNGFKDATRDKATVRLLWRKHPDAGIGIPTGERSGWLALDIDPRHGGDVSLTTLIEEHGDEWLQTMQARTGGGGLHFIFSFPQGSNIRNSARKLGEGIDVRGEGGYIIVPPSLHTSGRHYEWLNNLKPVQLPEWLLKRLTEEKQTSHGASIQKPQLCASGALISAVIPEGERNTGLFKIGCSLRGKGAEFAEIESELLRINLERCSPPLPDSEVRKIAGSAAKLAANRVAAGA